MADPVPAYLDPSVSTPAFFTDVYEYTMLEAARRDGTADRRCVFEVYARHLPAGRRYGIVAGLGRVLDAVKHFRADEEQIRFLLDRGIVGRSTAQWLEHYRFHGSIRAYREGEVYFPDSPVLQVESTFAEGTLLETIILSILNYDSAVASAASRITSAADDRPCVDMGARRMNEWASMAAARAAIVGGFAGTSNLAAAMKYDLPAIGTAAHAFTLLHDSEEDAFRSQVEAYGPGTTLLTDTYSVKDAIRTAVEIAGSGLGCVRIDSGDLGQMARMVRAELDSLGATRTKITVTNDLDEYSIAALQNAPVDSYGVGTRLVTGSGSPTCEMVYKLVEREGRDGAMHPVAKKSFGKQTIGWRKNAYRVYDDHADKEAGDGSAVLELVLAGSREKLDSVSLDGIVGPMEDARGLLVTAVDHGDVNEELCSHQALLAARGWHSHQLRELPMTALSLSADDPALPTQIVEL